MWLKNRIYCFIKRKTDRENFQFSSAEELADELLKYDVISFDVFDTLIFRKVSEPKDVFTEVGKRLNIAGFRELRVRAEIEARRLHFKNSGNYECNFDEIYEYIKTHSNINADAAKKTELEIEFETCYANPLMLEVFEILQKNSKKICIVSDMYLSGEVIRNLLEQCGFTGFSELLVSCENGCGKGGGELFKILLKRLPENVKVVHIGDNYSSDILGARAAGIRAVHYTKR